MSIPVLPTTVPSLKEDGSNWATFAMRFQEAMQATHHWGHFDGTNTCPVPKDAAHPTNAESETIKEWNREDVVVRGLLSPRLPDWIFLRLIDHKTAKGRWEQLIEELGQPAFADEPDAIDEGAHILNDRAELDLKEGQPGDPNANNPEGVAHLEPDSMWEETPNAPVHPEGMGPEVLKDVEEDRLLEVEEDGAARKAASVEGDVGPRVELQGPGVSCLAMQEDAGSLTLPSPTPPTTPEAASTQRSLAANTGAPDEEEHLQIVTPRGERAVERQNQTLPERLWVLWYTVWARLLKPLWGAALQILALLEFGIEAAPPPPNKAAKPPICQQPEQTQAPTGVGGSLESLPGEALQRATGQMGLMSARTYEGQMPIGEAHGRPPDIPDPQRQGSTTWEPASVIPKARVRAHQVRRPLLDMGAHTRPDPWPSLGVIIVDPDTCIRSASQLKGEQNLHLRCVGSELHAAPSAPQNSSSSFSPSPPVPLPLDTLARENLLRGEGAATERRAIDDCPRPKPSKLPDLHIEVLEEAGGALLTPGNSPVLPENIGPFGLAGATKKADAGGVEPLGIDVDEQGGVSSLMGAAPALAEGTAGVGPGGKAETATTAEPEVLAPRAQDKVGRGHEVDAPPQEALPQKGECNTEALSRKRKLERRPHSGERKSVRLPREAPQGDEGALEMPPRKHEHKHATTPQGVARHEIETPPRKGKLEVGTLPQGCTNEGDRKASWPLREPSHEDAPSTREGVDLWDPGGKPPRE